MWVHLRTWRETFRGHLGDCGICCCWTAETAASQSVSLLKGCLNRIGEYSSSFRFVDGLLDYGIDLRRSYSS